MSNHEAMWYWTKDQRVNRARREHLAEHKQGKRWKSIALWPDSVSLGCTPNESVDYHDTEEAARFVCRGLKRFGLGGLGHIFPISTRVEEVEDEPPTPHST